MDHIINKYQRLFSNFSQTLALKLLLLTRFLVGLHLFLFYRHTHTQRCFNNWSSLWGKKNPTRTVWQSLFSWSLTTWQNPEDPERRKEMYFSLIQCKEQENHLKIVLFVWNTMFEKALCVTQCDLYCWISVPLESQKKTD